MKALLLASAALAMMTLPALSQSQERVGQAVALMKVAPALCGTSTSEVASVLAAFEVIAELKHWNIGDLVAIGDEFRAQDEFNLRDPALCETVSALVKATSTLNATVVSPAWDSAEPDSNPVLEQEEEPAQPETTAQAGASSDVKTGIKTYCVQKWADDYEMQEYCIRNQTEAQRAVEQY